VGIVGKKMRTVVIHTPTHGENHTRTNSLGTPTTTIINHRRVLIPLNLLAFRSWAHSTLRTIEVIVQQVERWGIMGDKDEDVI
jgi:ABC-type molybdenum transport system ATPase subunit/photorepair protein PhrA